MNPVLFVLHHSPSPPGGFYVDVGANHPTRGSLTHKLDSEGWNGVCVEPNTELAALYAGRRNCSVETRVVGNGKLAQFVQENNDEVSGLAMPGTEHADAAAAAGRMVHTVRLEQALRERGAPQCITFLTVDVEGADEVVVSEELLNDFHFEFVLIERPHLHTSARLFEHGYLFSQHFFFDTLFVHTSHRQAANVANNKTYYPLPSRCRSPTTGNWLGRKRLEGACRSVFGCCQPI